MTKLAYVRIFSIFLLLFLAIFLFFVMDIGKTLDKAWMDDFVRNQGMQGVVIYIGIVTMLTAMGIPRQACSLLGGYIFGMWLGTIYATIANALACCLCFCYARFLGQRLIREKYAHKMQNFTDFICQSPFLLTLVVRIIPLGSNFLTNFLAGVSPIPARAFLGGSAIGFSVQNFIFATMGSGLHLDGALQFILSAIMYIVSLSLGFWVYRRYKTHKKNYTAT